MKTESIFFDFYTVKAVLALLGADWGCQTSAQAIHKGHCWRHRLRHVALVAGVQGLSALTADVSWNSRILFVSLNAGAHYLIDSFRMPKTLDQSLHVAVAVATAPLLRTPVESKRGLPS